MKRFECPNCGSDDLVPENPTRPLLRCMGCLFPIDYRDFYVDRKERKFAFDKNDYLVEVNNPKGR